MFSKKWTYVREKTKSTEPEIRARKQILDKWEVKHILEDENKILLQQENNYYCQINIIAYLH
jgi:hypothetical protein